MLIRVTRFSIKIENISRCEVSFRFFFRNVKVSYSIRDIVIEISIYLSFLAQHNKTANLRPILKMFWRSRSES